MSDNPLISAIVPCRNLGAYVAEAVQSALRQQDARVEVLLIDDGSDDAATVAVLDELGRAQGVRLIRTLNRGVAAARNLGLESARGDFLCFLDADDRLEPTAFLKMLRTLDANPSAVLAYPSGYRFGDYSADYWLPRFNRLRLLSLCAIPVPSLIRRSLVGPCRFRTTERGFEYEDWDFFLQLTRRAPAVHVPDVLFGYRERAASRVDKGADHHQEVLDDLRRLNAEDFSPSALMEAKRKWALAVTIVAAGDAHEKWQTLLEQDITLDAELTDSLLGKGRDYSHEWKGLGKYFLLCGKSQAADAAILRDLTERMEKGEFVENLYDGWEIYRTPGLSDGLDPLRTQSEFWAQTDDPGLWAELDEKLWRLTLPAWTKTEPPREVDELIGPPARFRTLRDRMERAGIRRYALFGAGKHTRYLLSKDWLAPAPVLIFDDFPKVDSLCGVPVRKPGLELLKRIDAILVATDAHERALYRRAADFARGELPVLRLYT